MNQNLADYQVLADFVDKLIAQKYPGEASQQYQPLRDELIDSLDDSIAMAVFGGLTKEQAERIEKILDSGTEDPQAFEDFFKESGIDLEQTITATMTDFGRQFLGEPNE